jgi:type VI secretion system secreted protein VgrG
MQCGDAQITVEKDGTIQIQGKKITVKGDGPILVQGQKIDVKSDGAVNVEASGKVVVKGSNVEMN